MPKISINATKALLLIFAVLSALFFGLFSLMFINIIGKHYVYLVSLPAAFILCLLFALDRYLFFTLVILSRASLDAVFDAVKLGSFGLGAVINAFVILIAIIFFFKNTKNTSLHIKPVNVSWALFLILAFASILYSPVKINSIKVALQFVSHAAMLYLGIMLVKTYGDFGKWIRAILYSSIVPVLYGLYSMIFHNFAGYRMYLGEGMRLLSTTNHPSCFSFYLMLLVTISFYVIKTKADYINPKLMKILPFYMLLLIGCLIMTKTRAGWAACGLYFVLYGVFFERKYLAYLFASCLLLLLIPDVQDRLLDLQKGNEVGWTGYEKLNSFAWRLQYWADSLAWMEKTRYFFGYGLSSFIHYSTDFGMGNAFQRQTSELPAHNVYVQTFFELGLFGVLFFVSIMLSTLHVLSKFYSHNKFLTFTALVIMLQYMLAGASDNLLNYLNYIWYQWFFIGLAIGYLQLKKDQNQTSQIKITSVAV